MKKLIVNMLWFTWQLQADDDTRSENDREIVQAIISNMVPRCGCGLTEDHVTRRGFQCFPSSPQAVTYRAELRGTREASVEDLLQDMQQWIQDGASFPVQLQILDVDSSCDLEISSFTEAECRDDGGGTVETTVAEQSIGVLVGAIAGAGVFLAVATVVIVVVVVIVIRRSRRASLKLETLG